ncbi:MAG TPA: hypothetical protein VFJ82_13320 [Longimicrobium sp.]|nr:hypothetical protein [Longimicrobium sp.]
MTAVLLASGAAFGALAAVVAAWIGFAITGQAFVLYHHSLLPLVALVGGVLGAPLLPAAMWLLLRRVPLGVALAGTFAAAVLGGIAGWVLPGTPDDVWWGSAPLLSLQSTHGVLGGLVGFCLAAVMLRVKFSSRREMAAARVAV